MSRSNTFYWRICTPNRDRHRHVDWEVGEDGLCPSCREWRFRRKRLCILEKDIPTRRGVWKRRQRYKIGMKTFISGPPRSVKQMWIKQARAKQRAEFQRNPEDPVITPMRRLIDLWDWY